MSQKVQADLQKNPELLSAMFGPEKENSLETETDAKNPKTPGLTEIKINGASHQTG